MTKTESRRGKAFEELVARMETTLAPHGAVVTSPDFIRDKITNRMREVDASIRIPDGDSTRLITVECRDHRKGKQDDRWIEQLVTKREKIGASLTVAVSSSGFSESAIISAKHFGIALRRLDEITDGEIAPEWAGLSKFKIEVLESQFHATDIALFGLNKTPITPDQLRPDLLHRLRSDLTFTRFLISRGDDPPISAADLGRMVNAPYLEKDGDSTAVTYTFDLHDGWYVETIDGPQPVSIVQVGFQYTLRILPAPICSVKQYSSEEQPLMELVSAKTDDASFKVEASVRLHKPIPRPQKNKR